MTLMSDTLMERAEQRISEAEQLLAQAMECLTHAPSGPRMRDWTNETVRLSEMRASLGDIRHRIREYRAFEQERESK